MGLVIIAFVAALTFASVTVLLYFYSMMLEARNRQSDRRIRELEKQNVVLRRALQAVRRGRIPASDVWIDFLKDDE